MHVNDNFILKKMGKQNVIIPLVDGGVDFSKVYNINSIGALIYESIKAGMSVDEIIDKILKDYEASREKVTLDVNSFIEELRKRDIIYD